MEWQKLTTSGSNAHLNALHLLGATSSIGEVANPAYLPNNQDLHLYDYSGNNTDWLDNNNNSNVSGDPWISEERSFFILSQIDGGPNQIYHKAFSVSFDGSTPSTYTGPLNGIPTNNIDPPLNIAQPLPTGPTSNIRHLFVEAGDGSEHIYSMTSPLINVTDWESKKLVFYFHMYGVSMGRLRVFMSPSQTNLDPSASTNLIMQYSNWPGTNGVVPGNNTIANSFWSGGSQNPADGTLLISGQIQEETGSPFNRVEIDLEDNTQGYIWIVYTTDGNPVSVTMADFAISNIYLELDGYTTPQTTEIDVYELSLKVLSEAIQIFGLPEEDPLIEGALYKDPDYLNQSNQHILISTGLPGGGVQDDDDWTQTSTQEGAIGDSSILYEGRNYR